MVEQKWKEKSCEYFERKIRMEHYLTNIKIKQLRHLSNININLNEHKRQHLLLTGKNGSGKTTVLLAMCYQMRTLNREDEKYDKGLVNHMIRYGEEFDLHYNDYWDSLDLRYNVYDDLDIAYKKGNFIIAFYPAERKTKITRAHGVEDIKLQEFYKIDDDPGAVLLKYMVHLKTQQAYARNESDIQNVDRIQKWFDRFENALRILFDNESIKLEYNYKDYDFKIIEDGRKPISLDQLSDGYSSVIRILSDLILRMDKNWLLKSDLSEYDIEGIVMIDELETHLHIELQKKILPFLTEFFPRIQFIVTTHSPYILNSISNAKAYDLEKHMELENLSAYSSEDLAEAYFDTDEYSEELKKKIETYQSLVEKKDLTDDERAERASLRSELRKISREMSGEARDKFEEIEMRRKAYD